MSITQGTPRRPPSAGCTIIELSSILGIPKHSLRSPKRAIVRQALMNTPNSRGKEEEHLVVLFTDMILIAEMTKQPKTKLHQFDVHYTLSLVGLTLQKYPTVIFIENQREGLSVLLESDPTTIYSVYTDLCARLAAINTAKELPRSVFRPPLDPRHRDHVVRGPANRSVAVVNPRKAGDENNENSHVDSANDENAPADPNEDEADEAEEVNGVSEGKTVKGGVEEESVEPRKVVRTTQKRRLPLEQLFEDTETAEDREEGDGSATPVPVPSEEDENGDAADANEDHLPLPIDESQEKGDEEEANSRSSIDSKELDELDRDAVEHDCADLDDVDLEELEEISDVKARSKIAFRVGQRVARHIFGEYLFLKVLGGHFLQFAGKIVIASDDVNFEKDVFRYLCFMDIIVLQRAYDRKYESYYIADCEMSQYKNMVTLKWINRTFVVNLDDGNNGRWMARWREAVDHAKARDETRSESERNEPIIVGNTILRRGKLCYGSLGDAAYIGDDDSRGAQSMHQIALSLGVTCDWLACRRRRLVVQGSLLAYGPEGTPETRRIILFTDRLLITKPTTYPTHSQHTHDLVDDIEMAFARAESDDCLVHIRGRNGGRRFLIADSPSRAHHWASEISRQAHIVSFLLLRMSKRTLNMIPMQLLESVNRVCRDLDAVHATIRDWEERQAALISAKAKGIVRPTTRTLTVKELFLDPETGAELPHDEEIDCRSVRTASPEGPFECDADLMFDDGMVARMDMDEDSSSIDDEDMESEEDEEEAEEVLPEDGQLRIRALVNTAAEEMRKQEKEVKDRDDGDDEADKKGVVDAEHRKNGMKKSYDPKYQQKKALNATDPDSRVPHKRSAAEPCLDDKAKRRPRSVKALDPDEIYNLMSKLEAAKELDRLLTEKERSYCARVPEEDDDKEEGKEGGEAGMPGEGPSMEGAAGTHDDGPSEEAPRDDQNGPEEDAIKERSKENVEGANMGGYIGSYAEAEEAGGSEETPEGASLGKSKDHGEEEEGAANDAGVPEDLRMEENADDAPREEDEAAVSEDPIEEAYVEEHKDDYSTESEASNSSSSLTDPVEEAQDDNDDDDKMKDNNDPSGLPVASATESLA